MRRRSERGEKKWYNMPKTFETYHDNHFTIVSYRHNKTEPYRATNLSYGPTGGKECLLFDVFIQTDKYVLKKLKVLKYKIH